jgi:hypothetical protein
MTWLYSLYIMLATFVGYHVHAYFRATGGLMGGPVTDADSHKMLAIGGVAASIPLIWPKIKPFITRFLPSGVGTLHPLPGTTPTPGGGFDFNAILSLYTGSQLEDFAFGVMERAVCIPGLGVHLREIVKRVVQWGVPVRYSLSVGWSQGEYAIEWPPKPAANPGTISGPTPAPAPAAPVVVTPPAVPSAPVNPPAPPPAAPV